MIPPIYRNLFILFILYAIGVSAFGMIIPSNIFLKFQKSTELRDQQPTDCTNRQCGNQAADEWFVSESGQFSNVRIKAHTGNGNGNHVSRWRFYEMPATGPWCIFAKGEITERPDNPHGNVAKDKDGDIL